MTPLATRGDAYVFRIRIGGATRDYRLHVPPAAASGRSLPLVLNLHGSTQNASPPRVAVGHGRVRPTATATSSPIPTGQRVATTLTPDPIAKDAQYSWNAGVCCGLPVDKHVDDVSFLKAVIDDAAHRTLVDRRRVYVTGMSSGGMMAYAMAAQASDRVGGDRVRVGPGRDAAIHPSRPVPTMEFHSVDDPIAKWVGVTNSDPKRRFSVMDGIDQWVQADGCARAPRVVNTIRGAAGSSSAGETATLVTYSPCRPGSQVALWRFTGSGHVWPGAPFNTGPRSTWILDGVGRGITLVDANQRMWQFFKRYELPNRSTG